MLGVAATLARGVGRAGLSSLRQNARLSVQEPSDVVAAGLATNRFVVCLPTVSAAAKSSRMSRKPQDSMVHPPVKALGK